MKEGLAKHMKINKFLDGVASSGFFQFLRFGLVGVLNNVISLTIYYIVVYFNAKLYLVGNALGFLISTLNAYICNHKFVFQADKKNSQEKHRLLKTYCVYIFSLMINTVILFVLVDLLRSNEKIAPICALAVTVPLNYMLNKFWVYR